MRPPCKICRIETRNVFVHGALFFASEATINFDISGALFFVIEHNESLDRLSLVKITPSSV